MRCHALYGCAVTRSTDVLCPYHPRRVVVGCRLGFQISPHASQRQYVDGETVFPAVITRVDSQNGQFVTVIGVIGPVSPGLGGLSQRVKLMETSRALMRDALDVGR